MPLEFDPSKILKLYNEIQTTAAQEAKAYISDLYSGYEYIHKFSVTALIMLICSIRLNKQINWTRILYDALCVTKTTNMVDNEMLKMMLYSHYICAKTSRLFKLAIFCCPLLYCCNHIVQTIGMYYDGDDDLEHVPSVYALAHIHKMGI